MFEVDNTMSFQMRPSKAKHRLSSSKSNNMTAFFFFLSIKYINSLLFHNHHNTYYTRAKRAQEKVKTSCMEWRKEKFYEVLESYESSTQNEGCSHIDKTADEEVLKIIYAEPNLY